MLAAFAPILEKIAPEAAKLGGKAIWQIIGVSSVGAGVVSFAMDKATDAIAKELEPKIEAKRQAYEQQRAVALEQKAQALKARLAAEAAVTVVEEVEAEPVEDTPKKTSPKKK